MRLLVCVFGQGFDYGILLGIETGRLGREVRTAALRFDGEWQSVSRRYNAKGQLEAVSMPYAGVSPGLWQEYEYDRFGRQTKLVEPSGSVSEWSYSGLTTTETSRGITSALVSAVISTSNESALIQSLNNISEEGYHLLTGTVSSFASGMANAYAYGNTDLIWQSIANGAISSVSNSIVNGLLSSTNQKAEEIELTKLGALSKKKKEWIKRRQDEANNEENTDLGYSANKQNLFSKNIHLPQLPFEYSSSFQMGEASYYNHNLYPIFIY